MVQPSNQMSFCIAPWSTKCKIPKSAQILMTQDQDAQISMLNIAMLGFAQIIATKSVFIGLRVR